MKVTKKLMCLILSASAVCASQRHEVYDPTKGPLVSGNTMGGQRGFGGGGELVPQQALASVILPSVQNQNGQMAVGAQNVQLYLE